MSYSINIKYELSGDATPLNPQDYIIGASSNPTSIEEGDSATLTFIADGMYFEMKSRKGATVTGATSTWKCSAPYTEATIALSNVTSDVEITIVAVVKVAPQIVTKPFLYKLAAPVDTRLILSKKEMREISDSNLPDTYFALCKDEGHFYLYNKNNELDPVTGKFRLITESVEVTIQALDGGEITE